MRRIRKRLSQLEAVKMEVHIRIARKDNLPIGIWGSAYQAGPLIEAEIQRQELRLRTLLGQPQPEPSDLI